MPPLDIRFLPLALLLGLALPRPRDARLVAAGFLLTALAVASVTLVLGDGTPAELAARIGERGVRTSYLTANAALLLVGLGLAATALAGGHGDLRVARTATLGLALVACVAWAGPLLLRGRLLVAIPAAVSGVLLLLALGVWAGGMRRASAPPELEAWAHRGWRAGLLEWGIVGAALLGLVVPDFGLALVLAGVALTLAWLARPPARGLARLPLVPVLALAALAVAALAWRAVGEDGLGLAELADAPFSPRLQVAMVAAVLPVLFALAGVPPLDRLMPGAALAPLAAVIASRALVPGLADGVLHWRSAAALWLVLAAADAIRRERSAPVLGCAALFVALVGGEAGRWPAITLALLAAATELVPRLARAVPERLARVTLALALVAGAVGLRATLAEEVVYSVAFVVLLTGGVLRGAGRPAEAPAATAA